MKKQTVRIRQNIINSFSKAIPFLFLLLSTLPLVAAADTTTAKMNVAANISYLGVLNTDELLFQVKFENSAKGQCYFSIKDQDGFILYEQRFMQENFTKKFLIQMESITTANLTFTFSNESGRSAQTFKVDTRLNEYTVAKL